MEAIQEAILTGPLREVNEGNRSKVYTGFAFTEDGRRNIPVHCKPLDPDSLLREIICSLIGRQWGLPIPEPFLICSDLPEFRLTQGVGFASKSVFENSVIFYVNASATTSLSFAKYFVARLLTWKTLPKAIVFDEIIRNTDRNMGNVLTLAGDDFTLIDHSETLDLSCELSDPSATNSLMSMAKKDAKLIQKMRKLLPKELLKDLQAINIFELASRAKANRFHPSPTRVVQMVHDRQLQIKKIMSKLLEVDDSQGELQLS